MNNTAYIGLGSNVGDQFAFLQNAIDKIEESSNYQILKLSSVYESVPLGNSDQNNYLNAALKLKTDLDYLELFHFIKNIETEIGRIKTQKWGPREIDLDLLFFNELIFSNDFITLPHKDIINRDFVIQPLCEIEPELIHPGYNEILHSFLDKLSERFVIKTLNKKLSIQETISE